MTRLTVPATRSLLITLIAVVAMLLVPRAIAGTPAQVPAPLSVQLKWYHQFQFAGYYAAEKMGYFTEEGLDVTLIEGNADRPPIEQVLSGKADFGVGDADILLAYLNGKPLVAVAAIFQHSPYILMTRADSGIRIPTDLHGKRIMLSDEQGIAQLKAVFQREGMSLDSVTVMPHTWDNNDLINGKVDAISAYATVEPFQLRQAGVEPAMIRAMDYGIDFYGDTLFTTSTMADNHPERVEALRRAVVKGWTYAMQNSEEMVQHIAAMPGVAERGITPDHLRFEASAMRELILPDLVDIGHMNPGRWETIARIYRSIGMIDTAPRDIDDMLFSPQRTRYPGWVTYALFSTLAAIAIALIVIGWNVQLRRTVARRTAELQAQMEYRRRTATQLYFFKCLMDQSHDPFFIIDPELGFRAIYVNAAACRHFGLSEEQLTERTLFSWDIDLTPEACDKLFDELREKRSITFQSRHRDAAGRIIPVEISANHIVHEDHEYIAGHFRDVTGEKQARETLEEARRHAEEANRTKDAFLAALSHELRTPLTPVLVEVSAMVADPTTPAELQSVLEMIERNIKLEARLIDDLLDLTRVARGKLHLYRQSIDMHDAIRRTIEICRPDVERKRLRITADLGAARHVVDGDEARLQQVIWNLLKNATKFTPDGGQITITTTNTSSGRLRIEVRDTGIGITPDNLDKVFNAFEQADPGIGRQFGGLGLGLAISRSIVEAHDGAIQAHSAGAGRGATFTVELDAVEAATPLADPRSEDDRPPGNSNGQDTSILLVEDNEDTLRIMAKLLRQPGRTVHTAASLHEARQIASSHAVDLVISDIGLPDGSGLDLMRHLRHGVKGIALSGYGMEDDIVRSREAGFVEHLTKPVDYRQLENAIRQHAR